MKVRYTQTSLVEVEEIFSFIAAENITAAKAVVNKTRSTVAQLGQFPFLGHVANESGVRAIQVGRYPFLVFYAVEREEVVILHVRHTARRRPWDENR